jgi:hypothetical protein
MVEIPEDVRAELEYAELHLSPTALAPETATFVPEDVLAEQDAANRALAAERSDDARRLALTEDDDQRRAGSWCSVRSASPRGTPPLTLAG